MALVWHVSVELTHERFGAQATKATGAEVRRRMGRRLLARTNPGVVDTAQDTRAVPGHEIKAATQSCVRAWLNESVG